MENKIPKNLLKSAYRKELWKNAQVVVRKVEKALPISSVHIIGSFASRKRRPADIDFVVMLQTKNKNKAKWSFDLLIAPDNKYGKYIFEIYKKYMKQKYGAKKSTVLRLR
jgi:hypothetical protein